MQAGAGAATKFTRVPVSRVTPRRTAQTNKRENHSTRISRNETTVLPELAYPVQHTQQEKMFIYLNVILGSWISKHAITTSWKLEAGAEAGAGLNMFQVPVFICRKYESHV